MSAMIPAIAGDAAEVPPISPTEGSAAALVEVTHVPQSETQIRYALLRKPLPAKNETSGISRFPSLGIPVIPVCQLGLLYPLAEQVPIVVDVEELVVQLLAPPPAPTVFTRLSTPCGLVFDVIKPFAILLQIVLAESFVVSAY